MTLGDNSLSSTVRRTARPARFDNHVRATAASSVRARASARRSGPRSSWRDGSGGHDRRPPRPEPLPAGTEQRIAKFTELVATAMSNVQARSDLAASRARIVAATDEERRRVVRDLHDGAQQSLVVTIMTLKQARQALEAETTSASELVSRAIEQTESANAELRELAHGILPPRSRTAGCPRA